MKYEIIGPKEDTPKIAFLCPRIDVKKIEKYYYNPHLKFLDAPIMVCDLYLDSTKKKTSVADIKEYLNDLIPHLIDEGIEIIVVTQPEYFKVLSKQTKTDATIGDWFDTPIPGVQTTYCPNYGRMYHDPDKIGPKIDLAMKTLIRWHDGDISKTGQNIIKFAEYPSTNQEKIAWLEKLLDMDCDLAIDIEGFDLKHYDCGIGTITFCWTETEGIAFSVDYLKYFVGDNEGINDPNQELRAALKDFFIRFKRKAIYHNICFDVYVLVYQLFMDHILDQEGMLEGLEVLLRNWDCTQLITYLATNSCAGNELGLKAQTQEYCGNYAVEDIKDIRLISEDKLLEYNLIDGLGTWYVYKKHWPTVVLDDQVNVYKTIFKPAVVDIIQMQLSGMPINMNKVQKLNVMLKKESADHITNMLGLKSVSSYLYDLEERAINQKNTTLKTKQVSRVDLGTTKDLTVEFNPNSSKQLQELLYDSNYLGLPTLDYTDTKQPSTGAETLEKLMNHTKDPDVIKLLEELIAYKAIAIILSTFLPAFLKAVKGIDGWHYLFGNFRLGGTASGRLSSNNPNLQNIPSSGSSKAKKRLAKLIKECFEAPSGWLFVGLDFDSLEDKISAVTTRDPEKIKVYSDGYDGHCLRALAYFGDQMPDIELTPENAKTYCAEIDGQKVYFHSGEEIVFQGKSMSGEDFYNNYC